MRVGGRGEQGKSNWVRQQPWRSDGTRAMKGTAVSSTTTNLLGQLCFCTLLYRSVLLGLKASAGQAVAHSARAMAELADKSDLFN